MLKWMSDEIACCVYWILLVRIGLCKNGRRKNYVVKVRTVFIWLKMECNGMFCEFGDEHHRKRNPWLAERAAVNLKL